MNKNAQNRSVMKLHGKLERISLRKKFQKNRKTRKPAKQEPLRKRSIKSRFSNFSKLLKQRKKEIRIKMMTSQVVKVVKMKFSMLLISLQHYTMK